MKTKVTLKTEFNENEASLRQKKSLLGGPRIRDSDTGSRAIESLSRKEHLILLSSARNTQGEVLCVWTKKP